MLSITSIPAHLTDCLSRAGSSSGCDGQAQFQRSLVEAAASIRNDTPVTAEAASFRPDVEVPRANAQMSSPSDRVVEALSSVYRSSAVTPASFDQRGTPQAQHDFEAMIASLREAYNGATQVSLVTKSISSLTSSVNKLIKEG
ncbi:nodulation protein NolB [Sinorhizobium terangae]|nr:nodulation protein NolB [Sinorhizobium terangae]